MPKIVVVGGRGFPGVQGGVEKHCEELYPRLAKLGCEVLVITRAPYISKERRLKEWRGVKFYHLWCPSKKSLEAITHTFLGILKAKTLSPDILHIHAIGPSLLTPFAKLLGLKVVMTHHGPDYKRAKWGKIAKFFLKLGERLAMRFSDRIIVISKEIQQEIKKKYNRDSIFIPNGVPSPLWMPPGEELNKWGLQPKKYVFTACRFVPEKGLHDLIEAYRKINNPLFKLVIVGDADHETDYTRQLKKAAKVTPGVILTGVLTGARLAEIFSNAGLFVLPSYYEGLPIALLEALSYELPVLVSDIPQNREIPIPEERFFKPGNIDELSVKMIELFTRGIDEKEKRYIRSILQENYNWDNIAKQTFEVYISLKSQCV
ncbi:MAG: glycosyltransferase family 4 protein [Thermodesulfovibrionales bacterium]